MIRRVALIVLCGMCIAAPAASAGARAELHSASAEQGEQALRRAEAILDGRAVKTGFELTPALKEVATRMGAMDPGDRARARRLLARPTAGSAQPGEREYDVPEHDPPHCTAHFCVHWVTSGADAPPMVFSEPGGIPDYVRTMATVFEHAYQVENGQLGWRAPKSDGSRGGDFGKVDVYVMDVGDEGIFGYATPDAGQTGRSQRAYLVMDDDYAQDEFPRYADYLAPMQVTAAHEYNHVLAFGYDVFQDTWFLESTAVWMEDVVYDDVNDYLAYVGPWAQLTQVPLTRFADSDQADPFNVKAYGDAVFSRWLDIRYGRDLIRGAWERSSTTNPASFAPAAYDGVLRGRGTSFFDAFTRFAADSAEWRSTGGGFGDRDGLLWPDVERATKQSLAPGGAGIQGTLDHTSYALVDVTPTADARIKLVASLPAGTAGAFALVGRRGSAVGGPIDVAMTRVREGGVASVALADPSRFSRITAVLVNGDASQDGWSRTAGDWAFERDGQAVSARISNRFAPLEVLARRPGPGAKVGRGTKIVLRFSAPLHRSSLKAIRLRDRAGRRISAKVSRSHGGTRVTLAPRGGLAASGRYTVELGAGLMDVDANGLAAGSRSWRFKTRG